MDFSLGVFIGGIFGGSTSFFMALIAVIGFAIVFIMGQSNVKLTKFTRVLVWVGIIMIPLGLILDTYMRGYSNANIKTKYECTQTLANYKSQFEDITFDKNVTIFTEYYVSNYGYGTPKAKRTVYTEPTDCLMLNLRAITKRDDNAPRD